MLDRGVKATGKNRKWTLSDEAFAALLDRLSPDRDSAAARYEALRARLIRFFGWERCAASPDLADEVLNRLARRLLEGERIESIDRYVYGIARLVLRESVNRVQRTAAALAELRLVPDAGAADEAPLACVGTCLGRLSPDERAFILEYYSGDGRQRIENRKRIARRLELPVNAVRNRALRLRERLERCCRDCLRDRER
jgi:DNA-directed RNA polymerase specialized sigma24 family protein